MQKIVPFLWFNDDAEEAMNFYVSVFRNSKIVSATPWPEGGPGPAGSFLTGKLVIEGQEFVVLNGGPQFKFNEAVSFVVSCTTQEEVDYYWDRLTDGGQESQCGWLKDRYGLSWQITPVQLIEMLRDKDPAKASRVMQAMLQMKKIEIGKLEEAYGQE
jgi:predicted 3-demethylubiquinone-9 3-methyltransferase (glyoxalase superfamily)